MIQFSKVRRTTVLVAFLVIFAEAAQARSFGADIDQDDLDRIIQNVDSNLWDISSSSSDSKMDNIKFVDNIVEYKAANPEIELVEMTRIDDPAAPAVKTYHLGARQSGNIFLLEFTN